MRDLFDEFEIHHVAPASVETPIVRAADPMTSHESAESLTSSGERARMMEVAENALRSSPGLTSKELERQHGYTDGELRKRLNDLRTAGRARVGETRKCSITGRSAQTWHPV